MKSLVIAEKPSVARDIARVLKCGKNINGAIEGDRYVVTWGLGHLVTLADPEDYDKKYKEWKMEDLPMMPEVFKLEVIKQTSKQYQAVKTQIYRGDTSITKRIEHDLYYIENWSLGFDFKIMFLTVFKGFINKNAY